jgi:hypothetical protein
LRSPAGAREVSAARESIKEFSGGEFGVAASGSGVL